MPRSILLFERLWPHYNRMGLVDGDLARVSHIEKTLLRMVPYYTWD